MAKILVIDDRMTDRAVVANLLGYYGHQLFQAIDGLDGLKMVRSERPDLVIVDMLMPTMNGYEFVSQLKKEPFCSGIPVIFWTAAFLEREARTLAESCGVAYFLRKPCEPELLLRTVNAALGASGMPPPPPGAVKQEDAFASLVRSLYEKGEQLNTVSMRLAALVQIGLELASEHQPAMLLAKFCHASRDIVGARYAMVGILDLAKLSLSHSYTSGMDAELAAKFKSSPSFGERVAEMFRSRMPLRLCERGTEGQKIDLPEELPPVQSLLGIPVQTSRCLYGWVCLFDKLGIGDFTEEDERLTSMLAALAAVSYQNAKLIAEIPAQAIPTRFDQSKSSAPPAAPRENPKEADRRS